MPLVIVAVVTDNSVAANLVVELLLNLASYLDDDDDCNGAADCLLVVLLCLALYHIQRQGQALAFRPLRVVLLCLALYQIQRKTRLRNALLCSLEEM